MSQFWDSHTPDCSDCKSYERELAESRKREESQAIRLANLTADLRLFESTANGIWRNQQMSTQAVASALLDLIIKLVDHALPQIDLALGMKPYAPTKEQSAAALVAAREGRT